MIYFDRFLELLRTDIYFVLWLGNLILLLLSPLIGSKLKAYYYPDKD